MKGDIGQAQLLDSSLIADTEIDPCDISQIRSEAPDKKIVCGGNRAFNAPARGRSVLTYT
jgi:hypothetical protein